MIITITGIVICLLGGLFIALFTGNKTDLTPVETTATTVETKATEETVATTEETKAETKAETTPTEKPIEEPETPKVDPYAPTGTGDIDASAINERDGLTFGEIKVHALDLIDMLALTGADEDAIAESVTDYLSKDGLTYGDLERIKEAKKEPVETVAPPKPAPKPNNGGGGSGESSVEKPANVNSGQMTKEELAKAQKAFLKVAGLPEDTIVQNGEAGNCIGHPEGWDLR